MDILVQTFFLTPQIHKRLVFLSGYSNEASPYEIIHETQFLQVLFAPPYRAKFTSPSQNYLLEMFYLVTIFLRRRPRLPVNRAPVLY